MPFQCRSVPFQCLLQYMYDFYYLPVTELSRGSGFGVVSVVLASFTSVAEGGAVVVRTKINPQRLVCCSFNSRKP